MGQRNAGVSKSLRAIPKCCESRAIELNVEMPVPELTSFA